MKPIYIWLIVGVLILLITLSLKSKKVQNTMKKTFDEYFAVLFGNETFKNDPDKIIVDSGGLTKYGISDLADKIQDGKYFGEDIKTMTVKRAKEIYKKTYFDPFASHFVDYPNLALNLFDVSVNSGINRAKELLIKTTGEKTVFGQLQIIKNLGDLKATEKFKVEREKFYKSLAENNPEKYGKYLKGWLNRIEKTLFL